MTQRTKETRCGHEERKEKRKNRKILHEEEQEKTSTRKSNKERRNEEINKQCRKKLLVLVGTQKKNIETLTTLMFPSQQAIYIK